MTSLHICTETKVAEAFHPYDASVIQVLLQALRSTAVSSHFADNISARIALIWCTAHNIIIRHHSYRVLSTNAVLLQHELVMYLSHLFVAASLLQAATSAVVPPEIDLGDDFDAAEAINEIVGFAEDARVQCATGVQMIVARGTNQKASKGSMTRLANQIMDRVPGSQAVGLQYPASKEPSYPDSEGTGTNHMTQYIKYYSTKCPDTKLVLLGYSQVSFRGSSEPNGLLADE